MELWIRTQNKIVLMKVDEICYAKVYKGEHSLWYRDILLGKYDTEKRALEVLDEIQTFIEKKCMKHISSSGMYYEKYVVYEMPSE